MFDRHMSQRPSSKQKRDRTASLLRQVELIFYTAVAFALALAGLALFGSAAYTFFTHLDEGSFAGNILELMDQMLLVFIVTELIHTVRAVIDENVLMTEPFLIVGIVAAIRRLIVISAEAQDAVGTGQFGDLMVEMGILIGVVVGLGVTIFLLRHTTHTEPRPAYEETG
jgi:uncharacterized membrane protein (DUF373 family)